MVSADRDLPAFVEFPGDQARAGALQMPGVDLANDHDFVLDDCHRVRGVPVRALPREVRTPLPGAVFQRIPEPPVTMHPLVEHHEMPREYKRHEWLVYTASPSMATVGWPMAVAEAQASGVGICMQNIHPDLANYIGPGAYLFDTLDEVASIIASPLPEYRRQQGFAQARRSDIKVHLSLLEALWKRR